MAVLAAVLRARSRLERALPLLEAGEDEDGGGAGILALLGDRRIALLVLALTVADSGIALVEPLVPGRLEEKFGVSTGLTGVVFLAVTVAYSVTSPLCGRFGAGWNRGLSAATGMCVMATALVLLGVAPNLGLTIGCLALLGTGMGLVDSSVFPELAELVDASFPQSYGAVFSLADSALSVGYVLGPLAGTALQHSLSFFLAVASYAGLLLLVAPVVAYAAWHDAKAPASPASGSPGKGKEHDEGLLSPGNWE
jgi:MFS family permease